MSVALSEITEVRGNGGEDGAGPTSGSVIDFDPSPSRRVRRVGIHDLDEDELTRLYGHSSGRTPADAAAFLAGYPGLWWVSGGWAVEAFTGDPRPHKDCDLSVPRRDLPLLRRFLAGRLDVWMADRGALRPLLSDEDPEGPPERVLPEGCENLWLRPGGDAPWEYDLILMSGDRDGWRYKRNPDVRLPWSELVEVRDDIPYLRAEVQLLHKSHGRRAKDRRDFEVALPLLDADRRAWLLDALRRTQPDDHPWIAALTSS